MGKFFTSKQQQVMQNMAEKAIMTSDEKLRRFGARGLFEMTRLKRFGGLRMPGFTKGKFGRAMLADALSTETRIMGGTMLFGGSVVGLGTYGLLKRRGKKKRANELAQSRVLARMQAS